MQIKSYFPVIKKVGKKELIMITLLGNVHIEHDLVI